MAVGSLAAQGKHAAAHQYCLAHPIRDAQYAIDAGDTVFAPDFKRFLQEACAVGRRRPDLADATIKAHERRLQRELDRLLARKPTVPAGRHLRDAIIVDARDKLLVFLKRRDIEPTNNAQRKSAAPVAAASRSCAAGVARAARMEARALRPARRPVATMEQMSAQP